MSYSHHHFTAASTSPWSTLASLARAGDTRALDQLIHEATDAREFDIAREAQAALDGEGFDELDRVLADGGEDYDADPEADRADYYHDVRRDARDCYGMGFGK